MADTGDTKSKEESKKSEQPKEVQNVCDLSIPSIIAALHQKALGKAVEKVADCRVANSALEDDGKTAKLKSSGQHIISILAKDESSKILKSQAIIALKEYVNWFVGPDLAAKVKDDVVLPLGEVGQSTNPAKSDEDDSDEDETTGESVKFKSFLDMLNEANDEDGEDDGLEGASDDEKDSSIGSADDGVDDEDREDDLENADDADQDKGLDASDKEEDKEESAPGYYIAYNLKVQGLKETALKDAMKKFAAEFFDTLTIKADGLFGGGQTLSVKQVKDEFKKVFGSIDPNKLKSTIQTKLEQKFPDLKTSLQVDIRDKNTLLRDLKGKKGFDTDVKDAISAANYSVTIQAEESDKQKKFLNLRVVADLVTSSISGLFKKFKNQITKDKVFLIPNFIDDNLKKGDKQSIRALEIKIPKPEEVNQAVTADIKALGKLVTVLGNMFDKVEQDKYFKSSENAQKIVSFWKKFYSNYDSKDKMSKAKSDEFTKFSSDYEKLYRDLGISKSIESDEDDEMHETITFLPKRALQKMILEMLFDEKFSINEDGKFSDLMGDDSDSKEDSKDAGGKADGNSEGNSESNSEGNSDNKPDDKKDGGSDGSNGSNAPSRNASGNDLYVIPMPGLKFPDDNEE